MSSRGAVVVGIVIVVVVILFFLLPVVPYSSSDTSLSAVGVKATAGVSPSYLVFNCGIAYNPSIGATYATASVASHPWQGGRWECGTGWQQ